MCDVGVEHDGEELRGGEGAGMALCQMSLLLVIVLPRSLSNSPMALTASMFCSLGLLSTLLDDDDDDGVET